eukprot:scaffold417_cov252-Pinguiococcus_pyrenoidosus.AAC.34
MIGSHPPSWALFAALYRPSAGFPARWLHLPGQDALLALHVRVDIALVGVDGCHGQRHRRFKGGVRRWRHGRHRWCDRRRGHVGRVVHGHHFRLERRAEGHGVGRRRVAGLRCAAQRRIRGC